MGSALGGVASGGLKVFTAGVGAAATGLATLGTVAVKSYADFEQLAGGIETLFGARGAESVEEYAVMVGKSVEEVQEEFTSLMEAQTLAMEHADEAYATAGLSANEYMETVTGLAASLKQSTETEYEAAEYANQAIIDMSDNANKMGSSMESIQNAYQGFAKQNYTMLDNLKLGYGGTKEEMQRLIDDANRVKEANGEMADLSIESFADVTEAIHIIQTEMGITGTTALEASTTIQGSTTAMKASWSNLVVGIATDNDNLEGLIDNFVGSVETVVWNLLPVVEQTLAGTGQLVESLLPIIVARIPEIVNTVLPELLISGANMLLTIIDGIINTLPALGNTAYELVEMLLTSIADNSESVFVSGSELLFDFMWGITDKIPDLLSMMIGAVLSLALAITEPNVLSNIISAGIELIVSLVTGLIDAVPKLLEAAPKLIAQLVAGLIASLPQLSSAALSIVMKLASGLLDSIGVLLDFPVQLYEDFINAFDKIKWSDIGTNMLKGLWRGIENGWDWLAKKVKSLANNIFGAACDALDIHSPSRKFKWIGEMCIEGVEEPLEEFNPFETFQNSMEANIGGLKANYANATAGMSGKGGMTYNQTVNVNQPVATPDELARTVRTESKYGLMTGGFAFG